MRSVQSSAVARMSATRFYHHRFLLKGYAAPARKMSARPAVPVATSAWPSGRCGPRWAAEYLGVMCGSECRAASLQDDASLALDPTSSPRAPHHPGRPRLSLVSQRQTWPGPASPNRSCGHGGGGWDGTTAAAGVDSGPSLLSARTKIYVPLVPVRMLALKVAVLVSAACLVHGYGSGAPPDACGDMIPQHHTDPQNSASPYQIRSAKTKTPGQVIVTIKGPETFKGFMVQCRVGNVPVGKFINPPSNVKLVDCGDGKGTAATHNDKSDKKEIVLTWKAPPNLKESVTCLATVAKNGGVFWVNQKANTLTF